MAPSGPTRGGVVLLTALATLGGIAAGQGPAGSRGPVTAAAPRDPIRFGEVPDFAFTERSGRTVTREDLLGKPWIVGLFFTSCAGPCPRLNGDIRRYLQDQLAGSDVRIVSLTVDPEHDTPEVLREYADAFTADADRWLFLTGDERALHTFAIDGLRLAVSPPPEDANAAGRLAQRLDITHATRLVAVDREGRIAGYYDCGGEGAADPAAIEASFAALLARARALDEDAPRSILPRVNATLNGVAAVLLVVGLVAIRRGRRSLHAGLMRSAFVASAAFLACYLYYHLVVLPVSGGPTPYHGTGWRRPAYLAMLASHVVLAVVNLPMVLRTLWLAHRERWAAHRRWAHWTYPIWLYVSVTGVLVYAVLYHWNPPGPA